MIQLSCGISSITPIVTGDHRHRNTELQASGLLGSLRYQYWLLKAMQAWQEKQPYPHCSAELPPAGDQFFTEKLHDAGPVIWLFGATNWKKMFRLEIAEAAQGEQQSCSARANDRIAPCKWNFKLTFRQDRTSHIFNELAEKEGFCFTDELRSLMAFVHYYGWLGAAPQNGLGWVEVQNDALETISLPKDKNNPVFAAKDIIFNKRETDDLKAELIRFFDKKYNDETEYGKRRRYSDSRDYIRLRQPEGNSLPIGYEIRRWLRDKKKPSFFFGGKDRAGVDHAGFVHVTHPDVQSDGSWRLRLRFAVRPDKIGDTTRLYPAHVDIAPQLWLDHCEKLLKSV